MTETGDGSIRPLFLLLAGRNSGVFVRGKGFRKWLVVFRRCHVGDSTPACSEKQKRETRAFRTRKS